MWSDHFITNGNVARAPHVRPMYGLRVLLSRVLQQGGRQADQPVLPNNPVICGQARPRSLPVAIDQIDDRWDQYPCT